MKTIRITFQDGRMVSRDVEGTFRHCQKIVYAAYGRLNLKKIEFWLQGRWIVSPYLMNPLETHP